MKKNITVRITGKRAEYGSAAQKLDMLTTGTLQKNDEGQYEITYIENELGYLGAQTTLKVEKDTVLITRNIGIPPNALTVEKGQRHLCHYETGHGQLLIGIYGESVSANLHDKGGELSLRYTMDINSIYSSKNELNIKISEV